MRDAVRSFDSASADSAPLSQKGSGNVGDHGPRVAMGRYKGHADDDQDKGNAD